MGLDLWIEKRYSDERKPREVMYWRKAYPIMDWFENHYDGVENCKEYPVCKEDIEGLLEYCEQIMDDGNFSVMDELSSIEWTDEYEITHWADWHMDWVKATKEWCDTFMEGNDYDDLYFIAWW